MRDIRPNPRPKREVDSDRAAEAEFRKELWSKEASLKSQRRKPRFAGAAVPITNVPVPKDTKAAKAPLPPTRPLFAGKPKKPAQPRAPMRLGGRERTLLVGFLFILLAVGLLAGFLFLPKADILLVVRTAPLLVDQPLTIRAEANDSPDVIAGTAFTREVEVAGVSPVRHTEVVGKKAAGTVQIVNRTFDEQKIKEQSRLVTAEGTLFYMQRHAIIPPASGGTPARVSVVVEAAEAGEAGNIAPQRLDFAALDEDSQQLVYAEATQALTGGSGENVPTVSAEDLTAAQESVRQTARTQVEEEIRQELPRGWVFLEESWQVDAEAFETAIQEGDQIAEIPYTAKGLIRVLGYESEALKARLKRALEERLEEEFALFPGEISYSIRVESVDWEKGEGKIVARVTHTTTPDFSLETLKAKLTNRGEKEAQDYLTSLPGVRAASIDLWPFWARTIPRIEKRIEITVESEKQP